MWGAETFEIGSQEALDDARRKIRERIKKIMSMTRKLYPKVDIDMFRNQ